MILLENSQRRDIQKETHITLKISPGKKLTNTEFSLPLKPKATSKTGKQLKKRKISRKEGIATALQGGCWNTCCGWPTGLFGKKLTAAGQWCYKLEAMRSHEAFGKKTVKWQDKGLEVEVEKVKEKAFLKLKLILSPLSLKNTHGLENVWPKPLQNNWNEQSKNSPLESTVSHCPGEQWHVNLIERA